MTLALICTVAPLIIAWSMLGPRALRWAAPALARTPLAAAVALIGIIASWIAAALAIGPVFAWVLSGPRVLSAGATNVCRRCLAHASPFDGPTIHTGLPTVVLLILPLLAGAAGLYVTARHAYRARRRARVTAAALRASSHHRYVANASVRLLDRTEATVFALAHRDGGIFISDAALGLLDRDELHAVLAHERAHLRQRHHGIMAVATALSAPVRWVPLVDAALSAIPHYLEIAADNAARRAVSTPALASALLKLDDQQRGQELIGALHVAGPNRVEQLVAATRLTWRGVTATTMIGIYAALSTTLTAGAYGSYVLAAGTCLWAP
ncbi:M56 family metallopeptidase [Gordonia sp. VNK1]|uniref:M56 family metallopeptidase n=1 Tax=Gordonia oleivorans TaxID=3156618 RepID=UPI0032B3C2BB